MNDTIYARATGPGPAAIAIVRVSGSSSRDVAAALVGSIPAARIATRVDVISPATGERLDRALALFFPAPNSATGEDVLELQLHGGGAVVRAVERAIADMAGVRLATAGEFTRRAVANGRLDLLEAEALGELLAADTELQRRLASSASLFLRNEIEAWRSALLALSADAEAAIDHDEDVDLPSLTTAASSLAGEIAGKLAWRPLERLRDGYRVVIAGPPNAGKSSLFNALTGTDDAIVSDIAGTTRDKIERVVTMDGLSLRLIDTAGQRDGAIDAIEAIGIARAIASMADADLVLWLGEAAPPADALWIHAKADLAPGPTKAQLAVSAHTGAGLDALLEAILSRLSARTPPPGEGLVTERQRDLLSQAEQALVLAATETDIVLLAYELAHAREAFDRLTGRVGIDDLLETVFSRFCLGK